MVDTRVRYIKYVGFNGAFRDMYLDEEPVRRIEVEMRVKKCKKCKEAGKDELQER